MDVDASHQEIAETKRRRAQPTLTEQVTILLAQNGVCLQTFWLLSLKKLGD
jgi:hypothetical protein